MIGLAGAGLVIAFLGGVVSFASPCCLPLIPAYLGYMVGASEEGRAGGRRTFMHGLAFVTGFTLVFVLLWASIGIVGYALADNAKYLRQLGGGLLILLGLNTTDVIDIPALWRELRPLPAMGGSMGSFGGSPTPTHPRLSRSLVFGTLFAAGWSPCIGPILGGIIGLATVSASVAEGTALLLAYALGLAVPFLAVALGATAVSRRLTWVGRHNHAVSVVSGGLLIAIGLLMVTNTLSRLAALGTPLGI